MASGRLVPEGYLARTLHTHLDIWQLDIHTADHLAAFAKDRGVDLVTWGSDVLRLWQAGLLRADFVLSAAPVEIAGLTLVGQRTSGEYWYADERAPRLGERAVLDCAKGLTEDEEGIRPYFHTFRLYVIHHLKRLLGVGDHIVRMQPLWGADRYASLVETVLNSIERFSLGDSFSSCIDRWHDVTAVAILAEPFAGERIFGRLRMPAGRTISEHRERLRAYRTELSALFHAVGLDRIEAGRKEICREELLIDPNKDLHNLVRLSLRRTGLDLRGDIGLAICFRTMAEVVRRAAEDLFALQLPEEDECGFGWPEAVRNFKQTVYGGQRILDDYSVAKAFLREQGLDRGVKVRWYVEGETEHGFLAHMIESIGTAGIELGNLRGQVARKNILTFRDDLKKDMEMQIFSLISVDNDRSDVRRAVRAAIEQGEMFGRVFMPAADLDFEFANFTLDEFLEALWRIAQQQGATDEFRERIRQAGQCSSSAKELIDKVSRAVPEYRFSKGEDWGRILAAYCMEKDTGSDAGPRPIQEAVIYAYRLQDKQYQRTREKYAVDPESGNMVERSKADRSGIPS